MIYRELWKLFEEEKWFQAEKMFEKISRTEAWNDELAVLGVAIYENLEKYEDGFQCIVRGLEYNYKNYELYLMLGNYYAGCNINQAYLCYENAEFYCNDEADLAVILEHKKAAEEHSDYRVKKLSIVILAYNLLDITTQCIQSIRENNIKSSYELVVVDNASTDGVREWLEEQKDIKLICNTENKGFPYGCNQGIKAADSEADIFLLNSDTVVPPNAIFWLRMGLYEREDIGATGSVSNCVNNDQRISKQYATLDEYIRFAITNNLPMKNPYEKKIWLVGFALMLKREALDEVGLLDVRFSPGIYEDDDIGLRLHLAGWQVILCRNSFIFHYGNGNGGNATLWNALMESNEKKFREKWNFAIKYYTWARKELIGLITKGTGEKISVLEIGCGMGATLARIQYLWPKAEVKGIELAEQIARIGASYLDIIQGNAESMEIPYQENSFDYIILGDVLEHLYDPQKLIMRFLPYLKEDGEFLCSIPNLMHMSVFMPLLKGSFDYEEAGILDRTHIRFFTLDSICKLFSECGLVIEDISGTTNSSFHTTENIQMLEELSQVSNVAAKDLFLIYQYIFRAKRG